LNVKRCHRPLAFPKIPMMAPCALTWSFRACSPPLQTRPDTATRAHAPTISAGVLHLKTAGTR
jgi:hypothetical protein